MYPLLGGYSLKEERTSQDKQTTHGYSLNHGGAVVEWPGLFDNAVDYYQAVLGVTPTPANIGLPQEIYEYLIFEKHEFCQRDPRTQQPIPYKPYEGYKPLAEKLAHRRQMRGWVQPAAFASETDPGAVVEAMIKKYPPATTPAERPPTLSIRRGRVGMPYLW